MKAGTQWAAPKTLCLFRQGVQLQIIFNGKVVAAPGALAVRKEILGVSAVVEHAEPGIHRKKGFSVFFIICIRIVDNPDGSQILRHRHPGKIIREKLAVRGGIGGGVAVRLRAPLRLPDRIGGDIRRGACGAFPFFT